MKTFNFLRLDNENKTIVQSEKNCSTFKLSHCTWQNAIQSPQNYRLQVHYGENKLKFKEIKKYFTPSLVIFQMRILRTNSRCYELKWKLRQDANIINSTNICYSVDFVLLKSERQYEKIKVVHSFHADFLNTN